MSAGHPESSLPQRLIEAHSHVVHFNQSTSPQQVWDSLQLIQRHAPRLPTSWFTVPFVQATLTLAQQAQEPTALPSGPPWDAQSMVYCCATLWASWLRRATSIPWDQQSLAHMVVNTAQHTLRRWLPNHTAQPHLPSLLALYMTCALSTGKVHDVNPLPLGETLVDATGALAGFIGSYYYLDSLLASLVHFLTHLPASVGAATLQNWHKRLWTGWCTINEGIPGISSAASMDLSPVRYPTEHIPSATHYLIRVSQMYQYLWKQLLGLPQASSLLNEDFTGDSTSWFSRWSHTLRDTIWPWRWLSSQTPVDMDNVAKIWDTPDFSPSEHGRLLVASLHWLLATDTPDCLALGILCSTAMLGVMELEPGNSPRNPSTLLKLQDSLKLVLMDHLTHFVTQPALTGSAYLSGLAMYGIGRFASAFSDDTAMAATLASLRPLDASTLAHWLVDCLIGHPLLLRIDISNNWWRTPSNETSYPAPRSSPSPLLFGPPTHLDTRFGHPLFKQLPGILRFYRVLLLQANHSPTIIQHYEKWETHARTLYLASDRYGWLENDTLGKSNATLHHMDNTLGDLGRDLVSQSPNAMGGTPRSLGQTAADDTMLGRFIRTTILAMVLMLRTTSSHFLGGDFVADPLRSSLICLPLNIFTQISPLLMTLYGLDGFPAYQATCTQLLDPMLTPLDTEHRGSRQPSSAQLAHEVANHLVSSCQYPISSFSGQSSPESHTLAGNLPSFAQQLRQLYILQTVEILTPQLSGSWLKQYILPMLHAYVLIPTRIDCPYAPYLRAVCHRLFLTIFECPRLGTLTKTLAAYYQQVLFVAYPDQLEPQQFRAAYTFLTKCLFEYDAALALALTESLCEKVQSTQIAPAGATNNTAQLTKNMRLSLNHGQYLQLLTEQVASFVFPYFGDYLLPRIRRYILEEPRLMTQTVALKALHEAVIARCEVSKKEIALPWLMQLEADVRKQQQKRKADEQN
ncbi:hypothetical protein IWQ62_003660 [Dispira parvispora]|uniref:Uncharacterized protein n=1 Tax=Dispira parvispora TaxID=1520584 RepID=A0A9W8E6V3_9FUNG|nr:hypothetical protein IWQ62_003660 [Dispira parvispora]